MRNFKTFFENFSSAKYDYAILPGGFKPPTSGHFFALKYILSEADEGVVFIGKKERNGITAEMSKGIWDVYSKYLNKPITVNISEISPVKSVYDFVDSKLDSKIIVGAGSKDSDIKRFDYFKKKSDIYSNVYVSSIPIQSEGISGTKTREVLSSNIEQGIDYFVPKELSQTDKDTIKNILLNK